MHPRPLKEIKTVSAQSRCPLRYRFVSHHEAPSLLCSRRGSAHIPAAALSGLLRWNLCDVLRSLVGDVTSLTQTTGTFQGDRGMFIGPSTGPSLARQQRRRRWHLHSNSPIQELTELSGTSRLRYLLTIPLLKSTRVHTLLQSINKLIKVASHPLLSE